MYELFVDQKYFGILKNPYITHQNEPDQTCWNGLNIILRINCLDNIEKYKNWSALKSPESVENIPQNFEQINKISLIELKPFIRTHITLIR